MAGNITGAVPRLSPQDRKELEKFAKYFVIKYAQIVVQSRLGEKIQTSSKALSSSTDWFSLSIQDISEVTLETKKALSNQTLNPGNPPVCIEISLRTSDGVSMVLETWVLGAVDESGTASRSTSAVYNKMGQLLKSLIVVTRVVPAYKLSRRQGPDSFVVCYRVYMGEPQIQVLGDGLQTFAIGHVETAIGIFSLSVSYRTKLTISPQRFESENSMLIKSDYFQPDYSPRICRSSNRGSSGSDQATTSDESSEACRTFINTPPEGAYHKSPATRRKSDYDRHSFDGNRVGAFVDSHKSSLLSDIQLPNLPFSNLIREIKEDKEGVEGENSSLEARRQRRSSGNNNFNTSGNNNTGHIDKSGVLGGMESRRSSTSLGPNEDFVMVELKTPFAESDPGQDLGAFFRECQSAPTLMSFAEHSSERVDVSSQLQMFETKLRDFDEMVKSLCLEEKD